jgi:hypothetical protein
MLITEIKVFKPNSREKEAVIRSAIPTQAVDALAERLGAEAKSKVEASLRMMKRQGADLVQFRLGDRRVRVTQSD